jgi:outer membrane protein assembly factor BamB
VNSIARLRTLAEIELYGPLSGRSETPAFIEPLGQNTWMGDFSRVDKRPMKLAESYSAPIVGRGGYDEDISWYPPMAQILVSEGRLLVARALGKNSAFSLDDPTKELYRGRAGGTGYTPYGALYGGLLLRCGNDGKLYCLNPDSGTELWSVKLGERLFGCPVAIGEDVFVANESGRLFQVDLANGSIMKEAAVSGGLFGSLTTDGTRLFFITEDGLLHALAVADLRPLWEVKVAEFTDSTPAVDGGVVYLADQKGRAMAVEADSGRTRWEAALGDEFCRCPVVGKDLIVFGCRGGTLAVLNRADGKLAWSKKVESRFQYEPLLLEDRVLFFRNTAAMLADLADGKEKSLQWTSKDPKTQQVQINDVKLGHDPVGSIGYYGGMLFFVDRAGEAWHNALYMNFPWHVTGGSFVVMKPTPPEPTPKVP